MLLVKGEHTHMYVVFENCIFEIEDEMPTELLICAGVKVQDIARGTYDPINFHQLATDILQKKAGDLCYKRGFSFLKTHKILTEVWQIK